MLVAAGLLAVLLAVGMAAVDVGLLVVGRSSAQAAADLAALGSLTGSVLPPRQVAEEIAAANGAHLVTCTCTVEDSVVTVEREVRLLPLGRAVTLRAQARAVLPSVPLYPDGLSREVPLAPRRRRAARA